MNNFEEWPEAEQKLKEALKDWEPHFELLQSPDEPDAPELMLFFTADTTTEWELFQSVPEDTLEDFADSIEEAKEELIKEAGLDIEKHIGRKLTDQLANELSQDLHAGLKHKTNEALKELFYNMVMYQEWVIAPASVLEIRYAEEIKTVQ